MRPSPAWAQLDFLTLGESLSLVERIPRVVAAQKNGECPTYSPQYSGADELWFQVRVSCGTKGGQLLDSYTVNRRTGAVTTWGDNPRNVLDADGRTLAAQLVRNARQRILTNEEAQCMAGAGAKALPGWSGAEVTVSVKTFGNLDAVESTQLFLATYRSSSPPLETGRMLTVFLAEPRVRDDSTGMNVMSAGIGDLISRIVEIRQPAWLRPDEAARVAQVVLRITASLRDGCRLTGGGTFYSEAIPIVVSCQDVAVPESQVLVNLRTGAVTDPNTGQSLESPESVRVARELLAQAQRRRDERQKEIESVCR